MTKLLCILAHPDIAASRANAALLVAIDQQPDVQVIDLYRAYSSAAIDVQLEVKKLMEADMIVLQFPVQWYAAPSMLKEWQDQVLTQMMYAAPDSQGVHLAGKPLMVVATTGATFNDYSPTGRNRFTVDALLSPLKATASRCAMRWLPPFVLYDTRNLDEKALADACKSLARHLARHLASHLASHSASVSAATMLPCIAKPDSACTTPPDISLRHLA